MSLPSRSNAVYRNCGVDRASQPAFNMDMAVTLKRRRFTVDEYHRMGEAGILSEDEPVELIASRHAGTVNRLNRLWTSRLGERAVVQIQTPIELPEEDSEPQPDVALLRPRADFYTAAHPVAADVLLLI